MTEAPFTIVDDGRVTTVDARASHAGVLLSKPAVRAGLGWEIRAEGLCRGDVCVPVRPGSTAVTADGADLVGLADLLGRPLAVDIEERAAYVGASAQERGARLASLEAPDFTLPDVDGRQHSLSTHRGKKVFLVAYASW